MVSPTIHQFIIILFLLFPSLVWAQKATVLESRIQEILREKVRISHIPTWMAYHRNKDSTYQPARETPSITSVTRWDNELRIGVTQRPESEIHAAMSPVDSSHLIIANIRYNPLDTIAPPLFPVYHSRDFGKTWLESPFTGEFPGDPTIGGGDPVLAIDSEGHGHLVWLLLKINPHTFIGSVGIYYAFSEDGGAFWDKQNIPVAKGSVFYDVVSDRISPIDQIVDKPWIAMDHSNGPNRDQLYVVYADISVQPTTQSRLLCRRKSRTETQFSSTPVQVNTQDFADVQFGSIDVGADGVVHVCFWASFGGSSYSLYHARSIDGGSSFLPETLISPVAFPRPDFRTGFYEPLIEGVTRLYPAPSLQVDKSQGPYRNRLYAVWNGYGIERKTTEGFDIYFTHSDDQGATWATPRVLNDDVFTERHQFFPSLTVGPSGAVIVSWYDRRNDPANVQTQYYLTYSPNGGQDFSTQQPVNHAAADFRDIGKQNKGFGVGEYTQVLASHGYALPFWADGRKNKGRIQVYTAQIPLTSTSTLLAERIQTLTDKIQLELIGPTHAPLLKLTLRHPTHVDISLTNLQGQQIDTWGGKKYAAGAHHVEIPMSQIPSGMYFLSILANDEYITQRILIP